MSKATYTSVVVAAVALVLAMLLNPSAERHREKIKQTISERSQLEQTLNIGGFAAFLSKYKSVGVASYTMMNERVLSVGMFGMVFVME
ncbi:MAG TPA: hypothetical protein VHK70_10635 [Burkholderiaceae bacterium]|jgi:hypothetical protein|nr:hypothetical protein [Burkholderiaceae bacterium]